MASNIMPAGTISVPESSHMTLERVHLYLCGQSSNVQLSDTVLIDLLSYRTEFCECKLRVASGFCEETKKSTIICGMYTYDDEHTLCLS